MTFLVTIACTIAIINIGVVKYNLRLRLSKDGIKNGTVANVEAVGRGQLPCVFFAESKFETE